MLIEGLLRIILLMFLIVKRQRINIARHLAESLPHQMLPQAVGVSECVRFTRVSSQFNSIWGPLPIYTKYIRMLYLIKFM
jgi:hypothetical protein